jgi:diketogulonate reductase-like aldo/keto reductase
LDPQLTKDGKPYGPQRYKQIVKECYYITKNTNTSYSDILMMHPSEREFMLEFITDEMKRMQEQMDKFKSTR